MDRRCGTNAAAYTASAPASPTCVEGVYDHHDYSDEKALALEKLAHLIETIVNPPQGNVVSLAGRQKSAAAGA